MRLVVRYHFTPFRLAIITKKCKVSAGEDVEKMKPLYMAERGYKMVQLVLKTVWWFCKKLNLDLPYESAISS